MDIGWDPVDKRGVSAIVATILLVVIAVGSSILLYLWITGQIKAEGETARELVKIEGLQLAESGGRTLIFVYVRNAGDITVLVNAIYLVRGSSATPLVLGYTMQSPPI